MLLNQRVLCPYCGETFDATIDVSVADQEYIEDCPICCRPICFHVHLAPDGQQPQVDVSRDDD